MSSPVRPKLSPEKGSSSTLRSNSAKKLQRIFRSPKQSEQEVASGASSPEPKSPSLKPKRRKSVNVDASRLESGSPHTPTTSPPRPSPYQLSVAGKEKSSRLPRSFSSPRPPQLKKLASPPRTPTRFGTVTTIASASLSTAASLVTQGSTSPEARPVGSPTSPRSPATPGSPDSPSRMRINSSPGRLEDESWRRIARRMSENIVAELLKPREQMDQTRPDPELLAQVTSNPSNSSNSSSTSHTTITTATTLSRRTTSDVTDTPSPATQSPHVLRKRRRSNDLVRDHNITRTPAPLAYPALANLWINQQSFERLDRPAQLVIHAFSAARMLHETGKATFGHEWSFPFGSDAPLRTWAQAGIAERTDRVEIRYLKGWRHFESHFSNGTLHLHFAEEMERIKAMPPGKARDAALLNLVKQADHVVNFSSEMIRRITLRVDVKTPEEFLAAWTAMSAENPSEYQKGVMRAYFGEKECIAIQAFNNAFFWLLDRTGDCYEPKQSRDMLVKTFYGLATQFLGFVFTELQLVLAKQLTDQYRTVLARLGVTNEELAAALSAHRKKNEGSQSAEKIEEKIEKHEEGELLAAFKPLWTSSYALIIKLSQGDTRFLDLYGLTITDPPQGPVLTSAQSTSVIESASPALPGNTAFPVPPSTTSLPALPATPSQPDQ